MSFIIAAIQDALVRYAVPVFIMITGVLMGNPKRPISLKKLYSKSILRFITAFLFWRIVYAMANKEFVLGIINRNFDIKNIDFKLSVHFWYMYMVIGLYMLLPFLRMVTASKKLMHYFVALSVIFSFALPQILMLPFWEYSPALSKVVEELQNYFYGSWMHHLGFGYYSYFVIGYYLSTIPIRKQELKKALFSGIIGFLYTAIMTPLVSWATNTKVEAFYNNMSLNVAAEAVCVFVVIRYFFENHPVSKVNAKRLSTASSYVFGIYLVHILVLRVMTKLIRPVDMQPLWSTPIIVILTFIVSYFISAILHKIPVVNKYIC